MRTFIALALCAGILLAQEPATIKVDVDIVNVLTSVRDKRGGLVANLEKKDFTIYEDGKAQEIKYFTRETDLPLTIGLLVDVSGFAVFHGCPAQEGHGVPDQLRRRDGAVAGLHQFAAAPD
jgi:hypothetical protein